MLTRLTPSPNTPLSPSTIINPPAYTPPEYEAHGVLYCIKVYNFMTNNTFLLQPTTPTHAIHTPVSKPVKKACLRPWYVTKGLLHSGL